MENNCAPVCLFVFKRPEKLRLTIGSLLKNTKARNSDLHIFSDAARNSSEQQFVDEVRKIAADVTGFRSVKLYCAEKNKGLANSIIDGVSDIIAQDGRVIVLEDDLCVSDNFLDYMNEGLETYHNNKKIFSISGFSVPIKNHRGDVYFTKRASSWGWATWYDRWKIIDWNVSDYNEFLDDPRLQKEFNKMGSDMCRMLREQMEHRINSWAIRWTYHQFRKDLLSVFPTVSKVLNEGFAEGSTHTKIINRTRFSTMLDTSKK